MAIPMDQPRGRRCVPPRFHADYDARLVSARTDIIPVIDGRAPLEVAARWPADRPLIMLHSGRLHPRWSRWSILTTPAAVYRFDGKSQLSILAHGSAEGLPAA